MFEKKLIESKLSHKPNIILIYTRLALVGKLHCLSHSMGKLLHLGWAIWQQWWLSVTFQTSKRTPDYRLALKCKKSWMPSGSLPGICPYRTAHHKLAAPPYSHWSCLNWCSQLWQWGEQTWIPIFPLASYPWLLAASTGNTERWGTEWSSNVRNCVRR